MNTLVKALIGTVILIVALIGLPILVGLVGVLWPVLLIIAVLIFIPIAVGIVIGKNSKED